MSLAPSSENALRGRSRVSVAVALSLALATGCGPAASRQEPSSGDDTSGDHAAVALTDDPARARAFQVPVETMVQPYDHALTLVIEGDDPAEVFGDIALADADSVAALRAHAARVGARTAEIGELWLSIAITRDRGQPESERFDRGSVELTAVRPGGVFRFTALHTEIRSMATAPDEAPMLPEAWSMLRDALVESLSGPDCRFLPRLRAQDMRGAFPETMITPLTPTMPDQSRIDRTCADLWDRQSVHRVLTIGDVKIYLVNDAREVVSVVPTTLTSADGVATLGALAFGD